MDSTAIGYLAREVHGPRAHGEEKTEWGCLPGIPVFDEANWQAYDRDITATTAIMTARSALHKRGVSGRIPRCARMVN